MLSCHVMSCYVTLSVNTTSHKSETSAFKFVEPLVKKQVGLARHQVSPLIKQLVHTSAWNERRVRCVGVARGVAESNSSFLSALQTSQVLHISMNARWRMNQLFCNIFNPMESFFFSKDLFADVMSVHNMEYEARSRNWIWSDKFQFSSEFQFQTVQSDLTKG